MIVISRRDSFGFPGLSTSTLLHSLKCHTVICESHISPQFTNYDIKAARRHLYIQKQNELYIVCEWKAIQNYVRLIEKNIKKFRSFGKNFCTLSTDVTL